MGTKGATKRRTKKPKGRRSAYMYFVKDYQKRLKEKMGSASLADRSKLCAFKWKHLPEKEKEKYRRLAEEDAARYRREMQRLTPREAKKFKRKRNPLAPVRPLSAYMWFCKSKWKEVASCHPQKKRTEITRELAKLWASSDENARERFDIMARYDQRLYREEKARYDGRHGKKAAS